jgi:pilus assembly protein Flp/PilA
LGNWRLRRAGPWRHARCFFGSIERGDDPRPTRSVATMEAPMLTNLLARLARADEGVTAIEYGLLAALISVAIITAASLVGTNMAAMFTTIAGSL